MYPNPIPFQQPNPTRCSTRNKKRVSTTPPSHPRRPNPTTTTTLPPLPILAIPPPSPQRLRPNTPLISQRLPPQLPHSPITSLQLFQSLRRGFHQLLQSAERRLADVFPEGAGVVGARWTFRRIGSGNLGHRVGRKRRGGFSGGG